LVGIFLVLQFRIPYAEDVMNSTRRRYTIVAIVLHWLIAGGILALLAIGLVMMHAAIPIATKFQLVQLHKSIGITILFLVLLRLLWRLFHAPPPLPETMPPLERKAAIGAHPLLYLAMVGLPLTGWAVVSVAPLNIPTFLFGLVHWPHMPILSTLTNKAPVSAVVTAIHTYGAWALIAVIALHAAAALRHHFIIRDDVLWRMLPILRKPRSAASDVEPMQAERTKS
jgi:cytochrome b561